MYSFPQQQKIFKELLSNNSSNKQCADCNTIGPTWASLNFGVFLCSNCSGAHRALGPTITRVKSTKLDQWQKDWMQCMQIGNKQVNQYWQAELGMSKKPRMGAPQPQLMKYASQKYVKKRFVKNPSQQDPLTRYKNGTYVRNNAKQQIKQQQTKTVIKTQPILNVQKSPAQIRSNVAIQNESKNLNLIQFEFPQSQKLEVQSQSSQINRLNGSHHGHPQNLVISNHAQREKSQCNTPYIKDDDDQFSQFTEHGTSFTGTTTQNNLTYEELIARRSNDSTDVKYSIPLSLHHTQSASSIPHNHPHFNVNMNGHTHHVGGQPQAQYGNNLNLKQLYNQVPQQNPYQSVGYLPVQTNVYQPQQYNSVYSGQNNQYLSGQSSMLAGQNFNLQQNNNFSLNYMSNQNQQNQQNLNPHSQTLGGYHNQGYGSHQGSSSQSSSGQKPEQFKWNDFSGWQGMGKMHQNQQQNQSNGKQQSQQQGKSWVDDWK